MTSSMHAMSQRSFGGPEVLELVETDFADAQRAFELLVRRHRRGLARYCRRMGLPEHRVEDVLQQGLTRAWLALDRGVEVREALFALCQLLRIKFYGRHKK